MQKKKKIDELIRKLDEDDLAHHEVVYFLLLKKIERKKVKN